MRGTLTVNARGFGFVNLDDEPDLFIQLEHLNTALHGDTVEALVFSSSRKNRPAGKITRIVERADTPIVGIYRERDKSDNSGGGKGSSKRGANKKTDNQAAEPIIHPEDQRLPELLSVSLDQSDAKLVKSLRSGHVVVAKLLSWEDRSQSPVVRITKILGDQDDPGMDLKIIAISNGLALEFSAEVAAEAERIQGPDIRAESKRRLDLRSVPCFTIDPPDARDLDDAVSVRQLPNGLFEVGVHIADVSHFVVPGSAIDREARQRGTSVYFVSEVLPMLPERLSADLCSLQPGEDRLAYSVITLVDALGAIHDIQIAESIIKSRHKFSYQAAQRVLEGAPHEHAGSLQLLELISRTLRQTRTARGSIDFDVGEKLITVDKDGIPRTVRPKERMEAHRLVEELMLLANRSIAGWIVKMQPGPFLFRNHERPKQEDIEAFVAALANLGIPYKTGEEVTPDDYRKILDLIQNLEFKDFIEKIALMSMTRAEYQTENRGHFALAFDAYTHFTSPIRRYADLTVHRLLKAIQAKHGAADTTESGEAKARRRRGGRRRRGSRNRAAALGAPSAEELSAICNECNTKSRTAEAAEREYIKMKSMEFLTRRIGNVYEGVISGVTSFGLFVELTRYLIEGLVPLTSLSDDYYSFDEENYRHVGKKTGKVYRLGDRVEVRVKSVSVEERKAEFAIV